MWISTGWIQTRAQALRYWISSLKLNKKKVLLKLRIFLYVHFLGCKSPPRGVHYLSNDKSRCLACYRHTVHNTGRLSSNYEIHTKNIVTCSYSSVHVRTVLLVTHGNSHFIIPVKVIRTLKCYEDWRKVSVRPKWSSNGACECGLPTDSTDTSQWKCHNCICGKRAVEKLTQYPRRIENIPANCLRSTSWQSVTSIPLLEETVYQTATSCAHCDSFSTQSSVDKRSVF